MFWLEEQPAHQVRHSQRNKFPIRTDTMSKSTRTLFRRSYRIEEANKADESGHRNDMSMSAHLLEGQSTYKA